MKMEDLKAPEKLLGIWSYLESSGALDSQNPEIIERARQLYERVYQRRYKRKRRKKLKQIRIELNFEDFKRLKTQSARFGEPISTHVKDLVLHHLDSQYYNPNKAAYSLVKQELALIRIKLDQIIEEDSDNELSYARDYKRLTDLLKTLEDRIESILNSPLKRKI